MTILKTTEEYKAIVKAYEKYFETNSTPSFSNLIWQFIINEANSQRDVVFSATHTKGGLEIVMVENEKGGYYPLHVYFKKSVSFNEANDITDELSEKMFGSTPDRTANIVLLSMTKPVTVA